VIDLADRILAGDRRALARAMTLVENQTAAGREIVRALYPYTGRAHTVGITGSGGAGKSTLTSALAREERRRGRTVGIIAVDPSSPFTHGAILGDRIRMQDLTGDPDIFMRSMATRGSLGGLAATTADAVAVLDAFGKDVIFIETVGAGQDEVEIASAAQTTVVINTPSTGDDVQTLKAGIMEIADILVVNKADLPGADALVAHLKALLSISEHGDWLIPILKVVASRGEGVAQLVDAIDRHRAYLVTSGRLESDQRARARHQLVAAAQAELLRRALHGIGDGWLDELVQAVAERRIDPHTAAGHLIDAVAG
jgi:LAO/AO transport system kinase